jgi:putative mRNA 3-end processing factor
LFGAIEDDPSAVFVQLTTGGIESVSGGSCTTHAFEVINHPTLETLDETVAELAPQHVVIKHATDGELNRFQKRYDKCFTWGTNDSHEHTIYKEGKWTAPGWLTNRNNPLTVEGVTKTVTRGGFYFHNTTSQYG